MGLLERSLDDILIDRAVSALQAFAIEQRALDPAVNFSVMRDRLTPINFSECPLVNVWLDTNDSVNGSKLAAGMSAAINFDCYTLGDDGGETDAAAEAMSRLYYLKQQVLFVLFRLVNADFGFNPGLIGRKKWPRFQMFPRANSGSEETIPAGRWTLEVEFAFEAEDIAGVPLVEVSVSDSLKKRWATLYNYGG